MKFNNVEKDLTNSLKSLYESKVETLYEDEDLLVERNIFSRAYDKMIAKFWPNSLGQPKIAAKIRLEAEGLYKSLLQRWVRFVSANKGNEDTIKTLPVLVKFLGGSSQVDKKILSNLAKVFAKDKMIGEKAVLTDSQIRDFLFRTALYYMRYDDDFQDILPLDREEAKPTPVKSEPAREEPKDSHDTAVNKVASYIKSNVSKRDPDLQDEFILDILRKSGVDPDAFMRRYVGRTRK